MIYLDTCYILKCYLTEPGSEEVRELTESADGLTSCVLARVEFASALHRHLREGRLSRSSARQVLRDFKADEDAGYWHWLGLTRSLLDDVWAAYGTLPPDVVVRTNDAIHLACARAHGFREIYSNDRRVLAAAFSFSLVGMDVIP